jgi:drug/metabolite transporter (DMT)-like permease
LQAKLLQRIGLPGGPFLAFSILNLAWGTTYLAIKVGVQTLPPALFGGTRIALAGLVLLIFLWGRGLLLPLPRRQILATTISALFLFVGGNGLLTVAEKTVDSGLASVLGATTPLWLAMVEATWPGGERLAGRGWIGLSLGLAGVLVLLYPRLENPRALVRDFGPLLVLGASASWSLGSVILRYGQRGGSYLVWAAYQMIVGGCGLALVGLLWGEAGSITREHFTSEALLAFVYLLIVGSLIGFLAYAWLLQHVSATMVGTHAFVNPVVAVLVGWLLGGEHITVWMLSGMAVILAGVALVRIGGIGGRGRKKILKGSKDTQSPYWTKMAVICCKARFWLNP